MTALLGLCGAACSSAPQANVEAPAAPVEATAAPVEAAAADPAAPATAAQPGAPVPAAQVSLKAKYAEYFPIGAAIDPKSMHTHAELLRQHFSSITTENEMKFESLQPKEGEFNFATADSMVAFARSHRMKVRGHALVWHRQTPDWVFTDQKGGKASPELLRKRLDAHIASVVGHYKGQVYAWDVVNEAIMDDGKYRTALEKDADQQSRWHGILGESYIAHAFRAAHAADPAALLFYNEYRNYIPIKRQAVYEMLKKLLSQGVPIHGVGLQCHLNIQTSEDESNHGYYQTVAELEKTIELYATLGLQVQVTELDLSLYVPGLKYTPDMFYSAATFRPDIEAKQAARYGEFFALFRKHRSRITGVTFWGIADDNTWLSEFSSGRKDFPLLFDEQHQPKQAFEAVVAF